MASKKSIFALLLLFFAKSILHSDQLANEVLSGDNIRYFYQDLMIDNIITTSDSNVIIASQGKVEITNSTFEGRVTLLGNYQIPNMPPSIVSGDNIINTTKKFSLNIQVQDDLTPNEDLDYQWSIISSEPNKTIHLSNSEILNPFIEVSDFGNFVLELTVSDGQLSSVQQFNLNVVDNLPPVITLGFVNAADAQGILTNNTSVKANVVDDKLSPENLTYKWEQISGEGDITFSEPNSLVSELTFSGLNGKYWGDYKVKFTANDGVHQVEKTLDIQVLNHLSLGDDFSTTDYTFNLTYHYLGTDDSNLKYQLEITNFPAGANVSTKLNTDARTADIQVDSRGDYTIKLTQTDQQLNELFYDEITVNVRNTPPVFNFGEEISVSSLQEKVTPSVSDAENPELLIYQWNYMGSTNGGSCEMTNATLRSPEIKFSKSDYYNFTLEVKDHDIEVYKNFMIKVDLPPIAKDFELYWLGNDRYYAVAKIEDDWSVEHQVDWSSDDERVSFTFSDNIPAEALIDQQGTYQLKLNVSDGFNSRAFIKSVPTGDAYVVGENSAFSTVEAVLAILPNPLTKPEKIVLVSGEPIPAFEIVDMVNSSHAPLTIQMDEGASLIEGPDRPCFISIINSENIIFDNLRIIDKANISGLILDNSSNITVKNSVFGEPPGWSSHFVEDTWAIKGVNRDQYKLTTQNVKFYGRSKVYLTRENN